MGWDEARTSPDFHWPSNRFEGSPGVAPHLDPNGLSTLRPRWLTCLSSVDTVRPGISDSVMTDIIEKLLIVQDRDYRLLRTQTELDSIEPERRTLQARAQGAQALVEAAKNKVMQIESSRKELELEVEALRQRIDKYSIQQFQTKKNEEYKALTHEIENCKASISKLEDRQLEFMESSDQVQREVAVANASLQAAKKVVDQQTSDLTQKEQRLQKQIADWQSDYTQLLGGVPENLLDRYSRLRKSKGDRVLVGIEHSVCGGCHMKLPTHIVVGCQGNQEMMACPNCGRILYYARHMDLAIVD